MPTGKTLHIITLDIPYPPDYGGMIDTFYRIKALHGSGIKIHLHCFEYGRNKARELEKLCESVTYYNRSKRIIDHLSLIPFIVASRQSGDLLKNLNADNHPVLFDGLHTTFYLDHPSLSGRKKIVRMHNIEHRYYRSAARNEKNLFRKAYFLIESLKLRFYERKMIYADSILSISVADKNYFEAGFGRSELSLPFIPFDKPVCKPGSGEYIIYHGNLSVKENEVLFELLAKEVFSNVDFPVIIAGKKPSEKLRKIISSLKNTSLISDPGEDRMLELIRDAHINILPVRSGDGFKLKLLYALFAGRHCITNSIMLKDTYLTSLCHIADDSQAIIDKINTLIKQPFTEVMISERERILCETFSNTGNAQTIIRLLS